MEDDKITILSLLEDKNETDNLGKFQEIKNETIMDEDIDVKDIRKIYFSIRKIFINNDQKFDQKLLISSLISSIKIVDKYKSISGPSRKKLVLYLLKLVLKDFYKSDGDMVDFLVDTFGPDLIDTFINIDKRKIRIKLFSVKKFFKRLFCCNKCQKTSTPVINEK